jgi:serine protease Do
MTHRTKGRILTLVAAATLHGGSASAQVSGPGDALEGLNSAVETMVHAVSPSVVQVLVSKFDTQRQSQRSDVLDWEHSVGSGVIVSPDGYIVTNAHVVAQAQQISVRVIPAEAGSIGNVLSQSFLKPVNANLVGTFAEADLALLKIPAENLPALRIADFGALRQGHVVFAFGSPSGLHNSVTMGVVSSVARQLDPDSPMLYIQTDTAINPGNSGGPLVSTKGEMVGLNTFISTQSGGSEGIGFAIPGVLVQWVYQQLREHGHVHRPVIGAGLQTITPSLAAALKLPRDSGVIVSDLMPNTPAAKAGIKLNDIIVSVNDRQMDNIAAWMGLSFQHVAGSALTLNVLRGTQSLSFSVVPTVIEEPSDRLADLKDLLQRQIPSLGILAITLDSRTAEAIGTVRLASGAVVIARIPNPRGSDIGLQPGDLIHEMNGKNVFSADDLRTLAAQLKPGESVALLVERDGRWSYLSFDMP